MPDDLPAALFDASDFAAAGFPPRYREPTTSAYRRDLRCFWQWCADHQLAPLAAKRPHLELYLRDLEQREYAPATVSRRLSTVAGLFKYAVIDELVASNPTLAVTRPHVRWESQHRTVLHPLEFAAVLSTARQHAPPPTRWSRCSECWGYASPRPATHRSPTCTTSAATRCFTCSAKAPSRRYACYARYARAARGRSERTLPPAGAKPASPSTGSSSTRACCSSTMSASSTDQPISTASVSPLALGSATSTIFLRALGFSRGT